MSDRMVVDDRGPQAPAQPFHVTELVVDPAWVGDIVEIGGAQVAVLAFDFPVPVHGRVYFAPSPQSLTRLEDWIARVRTQLSATSPNPSNIVGLSENGAENPPDLQKPGSNGSKPPLTGGIHGA